MRRYETIFILRPNTGEEEINRVIESTTSIITEDAGTIIELNKWGLKKLAYLIKKESLGYYVFCDYAGTPAAVSEIERKFRIDDAVMKYMTIKIGDDISAEAIQAAITAASEKASEVIESENDDDSKPAEKAEDSSESATETESAKED